MLGPIARTLITRSTAHSFIAACRGGRLVVVNEGNAGRKLKRSNPIKSTGPPSLPSPPSRAKPRSPFAAFRGIISRNKVLGSPNKKMYDHFSEERKRGGGQARHMQAARKTDSPPRVSLPPRSGTSAAIFHSHHEPEASITVEIELLPSRGRGGREKARETLYASRIIIGGTKRNNDPSGFFRALYASYTEKRESGAGVISRRGGRSGLIDGLEDFGVRETARRGTK